jgi:hypothetical protein
MLDNQFQFALLATEDRVRAMRRRVPTDRGTKRIFRLSGDRRSTRESGAR